MLCWCENIFESPSNGDNVDASSRGLRLVESSLPARCHEVRAHQADAFGKRQFLMPPTCSLGFQNLRQPLGSIAQALGWFETLVSDSMPSAAWRITEFSMLYVAQSQLSVFGARLILRHRIALEQSPQA